MPTDPSSSVSPDEDDLFVLLPRGAEKAILRALVPPLVRLLLPVVRQELANAQAAKRQEEETKRASAQDGPADIQGG
jgi:hypothetical protein